VRDYRGIRTEMDDSTVRDRPVPGLAAGGGADGGDADGDDADGDDAEMTCSATLSSGRRTGLDPFEVP
jgi:hypothetical protein